MYFMPHPVSNQQPRTSRLLRLWDLTRCQSSHISMNHESPRWYWRAVKIKEHEQIADTIKLFTGRWAEPSQGFDVLAYKPLWPLVDMLPLAIPSFGTPGSTASVLARKSMCVTDPTMNLPYPSCLFHSCLPDEQAHHGSLGFTCAGEDCSSEVGLEIDLPFRAFDPDVWCKTQTPTHQREWGGGENWFLFCRKYWLSALKWWGIYRVLPHDLLL